MRDILHYPNPLKRRRNTVLLNDGFSFSFDGEAWQPIRVPYCPESRLSGIGYTDFIPCCYYRKSFRTEKTDGRIFLHFGAVDYMTTVYVIDKYVGMHIGGYTPFHFDITEYTRGGEENTLFVIVRDDALKNTARGKQSYKKNSFGCFYTRTSGIWQSVWLEYLPADYIREFYFYPRIDTPAVGIHLVVSGRGRYDIEVRYRGRPMGAASGYIAFDDTIGIPLAEKHLWDVGHGALYDVVLRFNDDEVHSYFGLREVRYEGLDFLLNGRKVYQRFVLDQGYNPDGIYTAASPDDMARDIRLSTELGFNGSRLHQKVFEPQFLYLCDRAGYMVWGEFPSWGIDFSDNKRVGQFLSEWGEVLRRDFNHPSIVTWCPLNEVWGAWDNPDKRGDVRFAQSVYQYTKIYDTTRPCVDVSGGWHGDSTDLFDFHSYEEPDVLVRYFSALDEHDVLDVPLLYGDERDIRYRPGQPVQISECGGFAFDRAAEADSVPCINRGAVMTGESWGYGKSEQEGERFVTRYETLMRTVLSCRKLSGFCYTQLYDVEQEVNGFYTYDRRDKLTPAEKARIRAVNLQFEQQ